jgi:hypothetical protein
MHIGIMATTFVRNKLKHGSMRYQSGTEMNENVITYEILVLRRVYDL